MNSTNQKFLDAAEQAVQSIDIAYQKADFNGKLQLKEFRTKAMDVYAQARRRLLEDAAICQDSDVAEMGNIRDEISKCAQTQTFIVGIGKMITLISKFVV